MDYFDFTGYIGSQLNNEKNTKIEAYVPPKAASVIIQKCPLLPATQIHNLKSKWNYSYKTKYQCNKYYACYPNIENEYPS